MTPEQYEAKLADSRERQRMIRSRNPERVRRDYKRRVLRRKLRALGLHGREVIEIARREYP